MSTIIGDNIKKARKTAGLTQSELAGKLGITQSAVAKIENEAGNIKHSTIEKIATALGLSAYDLYDDSVQMWIKMAKKYGGRLESVTVHDPAIKKKRDELIYHYDKLNSVGQYEALKRVEELTHIEKYVKRDDPIINTDHKRTDADIPKDDNKFDDGIMDDDDF